MCRTATLLISLVALFLVPFTLTGTSVALSDISSALHASLAATQWVVNAYSATFASFMLVTGSLADRIGRRRVFASGVAVFAGCGLLSALAQNIVLLDVARLLAGVGAAATATGASAVLAAAFTGPARAKVFGLFGTTIGIGLAFGPTLSALVVHEWGWRAVFTLPGVLGLVCLAFFRWLPASVPDPSKPPMDHAGAVLFTASLLLLIFGLVEGPALGWTDVRVVTALLTAVLLLVVFVAVERRAAIPLLNLSLFSTARFLGLCLAIVAVVGVFAPLLIYLPTFFQTSLGMSVNESGLAMIALTGPILVVPLLCGIAVRWVRGPVQVVVSLVLVAAGAAWLAAGAALIPALLVLGIGVAIAQGLLDGLAVSAVPPEHAGAAAGTFNTAKLTAETLGIAVVGSVLAAMTDNRLAGPAFPAALHLTLWYFAALAALTAVATSVLLRPRGDPEVTPPRPTDSTTLMDRPTVPEPSEDGSGTAAAASTTVTD
ncbi:MFS transporter [Pseudonocardia spinosispora]|uniref:MFS transporter n=1 Tax=Pseudonocardia spinosispora TaxID=103441 RepID=UPI00040D85B9|nr:MFS transporter [Pseudonocardia spinosispora]